MKKDYLVILPERLWHWLNATAFIALVLSGYFIHQSEHFQGFSLTTLITIHNVAAAIFVLNFLFWLGLEIYTGRIRNYVKLEKNMGRRLLIQARFYLFDIFMGKPHPFPTEVGSKFNPLQRFTYLGLMFVMLPLQMLSGAVLYGVTLRFDWIMNLPVFKILALTHTALSYTLMAFLMGHLYLATTGDTPLSLFEYMITGYHKSKHSGKDVSNEVA